MTDTTYLHRLVSVPAEARRMYPRGELFGLEPAQLQVLIALATGDADDTNGLAELLAMNRSTVSHSLRVLDREGLVVRNEDHEDARRSRYSPSSAGRDLVTQFAAQT